MTEHDSDREPGPPTDARRESLDERLKRAQAAEAARSGTTQSSSDAQYRAGNRVLSYLIGGPLGGALVGWVLDRWLGTYPWIMLVMLFLGIAAGFRSIFRLAKQRPD